nr:endonuclease/exonuclease/phosphatase family protein [Rosenbergiella nectarea]
MDILFHLLNERWLDVMCLCEVSPEDIVNISKILDDRFSVYNGAFKSGRKKFDICVIYRNQVLTCIGSSLVSKPHQTGKEIYAGQNVEFIINETEEILVLFIAHWSSRLYDYEDSPNKAQLGMLLQAAIQKCFSDKKNNVIVLGDFNEEPFNKSITEHLGASRDIALVKKRPGLLYNPFWRHLTYSTLLPNSDTKNTHGGTYYYKGDDTSRWKTFDQMMFSSNFVSGKSWCLNELETIVFSNPDFLEYINNAKSKFDHLPILSVIERVNNG